MRIECEKCNAAFTIDDSVLSDKPIGAQCPYCSHVRVVTSADAEGATAVGHPGTAPPDFGHQGGAVPSAEVGGERPSYGGPPAFDLNGPDLGASGAPPQREPSLPPFAGPSSVAPLGSLDPMAGPAGLSQPPAPGAPAREMTEGYVPGGGSVAPGARFDTGLGPSGPPESPGQAGRISTGLTNADGRCQVCQTPLTDEFDKVIGLCEQHQKDRGGAPGATAGTGSARYSVKLTNGEVVGPLELDDVRSQLEGGTFSTATLFSQDGFDWQPAESIEELRPYTAARSIAPGARKSQEAPAPNARRPMVAPRRPARAISLSGILVGVVVVSGIAAIGTMLAEPEILDGLYERLAGGPSSNLRSPNPLRKRIDQWRTVHKDLGGTAEEHLRAARELHFLDSAEGYREANRALEKALILEEDNAAVIAAYIENMLIWRGELVSSAERQKLSAAARFARERAKANAGVLRALATFACTNNTLAACRTESEKAERASGQDGRAALLRAQSYVGGHRAEAIHIVEAASVGFPALKRADRFLAAAYASAGRYGSAFRRLTDRMKDDGDNVAVRALAGDLEQQLGHPDVAASHYRAAAAGQGDNDAARLKLAQLELRRGHAAAAAKLYAKVLQNASAPAAYQALAHGGTARALLDQRRFEAAAASANVALGFPEHQASSEVVMAEIFVYAGQPEKARPLLEKALRTRFRDEPAVLALSARAELGLGNVSKALRRSEAAVKRAPNDLRYRAIQAGIYLAVGREDEAFGVMRKAGEKDPAAVPIPPSVVVPRLTFLGLRDAAIGTRAQDDRRSPTSVDIPLVSMLALRDTLKQFKRQTKIRRNRSVAYSAMAMLHYTLGETAKARAHIDAALKADRQNSVALMYDAQLKIGQGQFKGAIKSAERSIRVDRAAAPTYLVLGRAYLGAKKPERARTAFESALRTQSNLAGAQAALAALNLKTDRDAAISALQKTFDRAPTDVSTRRLLRKAGF